jgi:hypothetical protein
MLNRRFVLTKADIFTNVPVFYETVRFKRAGFHDPRHNAMTLYEGAPNAQNEAAWSHLLGGKPKCIFIKIHHTRC